MAISFIAANSANSNTVAIPTHQFGDLIVFISYRSDGNFNSSLPSGYVQNTRNSGSGNGQIIATRIASSSSESTPSIADATQVIIAIYRSTTGKVILASSGSVSSSSSTTVIYSTVSFSGSNITDKWHVGMAGHKSIDTSLQTAPTGMTNRASQVGGSEGHLVLHDTNANQATWNQQSVSVGGTSNIWRSAIIEVLELDATYPSGGGTPSIINPFTQQVIG
jgi:hypothetical protein